MKKEMLLQVFADQDGTWRHIRGCFCSPVVGQWGYESLEYGDPMASVKIRSQLDRDRLSAGSDKLYAITVKWGGDDDLAGVEEGVKILRKIALRLGKVLGHSRVSRWIEDYTPNGEAFKAIAKACGCSGMVVNNQRLSIDQGGAAIDGILLGWLAEFKGKDVHVG